MPDYRNIVAVDTSTLTGSVALLIDGAPRAERSVRSKAGHASKILGGIDGVITDGGLGSPREVDLFVIGAGPGSFTGLRIGLASIKAMAFALDKPVYPVSSLEGLARGASGRGSIVVPCFDARKGQLYAAAFERAGSGADLVRLLPDRAFDLTALIDAVAALTEEHSDLVFVGDGLKRYGEAFGEAFGGATLLDATFASVRASQLAQIANRRATPEAIPQLETLEPNYQRASEAELGIGRR